MPETSSQSFEKHTRWDPVFHFFMGPVAIITFIWVAIHAYKNPSAWTAWQLVVAIALVVSIFKIRLYALKVQDRVIRLEERLRLATLVPNDLRPRIKDLKENQLIALRFCSDEELPALAARTLAENLKGKDIKKHIKTWRADEFRV
jgi:hypothetical protein